MNPVPLHRNLPGDGLLSLLHLIIDAPQGAAGPVVAVLVMDDWSRRPPLGPARPWLGEHVPVGICSPGCSHRHRKTT